MINSAHTGQHRRRLKPSSTFCTQQNSSLYVFALTQDYMDHDPLANGVRARLAQLMKPDYEMDDE